MRLRLENKTALPGHAEEINQIARFVASQFTQIKGAITVIIRKARYVHHEHHGNYHARTAKCFVNFNDAFYPKTVTERLYFKHASGQPNEYTLNSWQESLVHIVAHELAHGTWANKRMRRSRQELHSENTATDVLNRYREQAAFLRTKARAVEADRRTATAKPTNVVIDDKIVALLARRKSWVTKSKRAATALRKIDRALKRYERKAAIAETVAA